MVNTIVVAALYVYPVKSARGIALERASVTERGILHDRRFMIVDEAGAFITQRELPRMARLSTAIEADCLTLTWDGLGTEQVPLIHATGPIRKVRVWHDEVDAIDLGAQINRFLSKALGVTAALVYMPETTERVPSLEYARATDRVGFADGFPYLFASESSLADLNGRMGEPVPMNRFRPNLVVSGAEAYAEDTWHELRVGDLQFEIVKPCARCVITTTDQTLGERAGMQPLASLSRYRRFGGEAMFGQNAIARDVGTVALGAEVHVESMRPRTADEDAI